MGRDDDRVPAGGTGRGAAVGLMRRLGAGQVEHLGGDLLSHLVRTEEILRSWDVPEPVALAGLCHATYGTDGFPQALLPTTERATLAAAAGDEAEAITYLYGSCDRAAVTPRLGPPAVRFRDRFDGRESDPPPGHLRAFALVTLANELELVRSGALDDPGSRAALADLFARLRPYAGPLADAAVAEVRPG
jgi:hypothetical protein